MAARAYQPSPDARRQVESMAGYGIPQKDIASILKIDEKTLRKYFPDELDRGRAVANVNIGKSLYDQAVGRGAEYDPKTGKLIREEMKPDKSVSIFLGKVRLGMVETRRTEVSGPNGGPLHTIDIDLSVFNDEELRLFMQLYEKARVRARAGGDAKT
jgi:hypothetical protein